MAPVCRCGKKALCDPRWQEEDVRYCDTSDNWLRQRQHSGGLGHARNLKFEGQQHSGTGQSSDETNKQQTSSHAPLRRPDEVVLRFWQTDWLVISSLVCILCSRFLWN
jgi:hypothetical protein